MERFELVLSSDRGALARVVAWATSRRWNVVSLDYPRAESPDRRNLVLELEVGDRRSLVVRQLERLVDVLSVR